MKSAGNKLHVLSKNLTTTNWHYHKCLTSSSKILRLKPHLLGFLWVFFPAFKTILRLKKKFATVFPQTPSSPPPPFTRNSRNRSQLRRCAPEDVSIGQRSCHPWHQSSCDLARSSKKRFVVKREFVDVKSTSFFWGN